jgi:arginine repressor
MHFKVCRKERKKRKHYLDQSVFVKNQRGSLAQISQTEVARWAKEIGAFKIETPK